MPADDDTPRATAATWVAATGALLLLVAAGTFLAVSWDVLGITARVAVVATITSAAIVGGHRLRRVLPAVGAVIYHLGALLLPVDAIGLALQLELSIAAAWILTGAVAVVALPPLAIAGRSRVLAVAAVIGVPVLATGIGLAGAAAPSLLVASAAVITLGLLQLRGTRVARIWHATPVALAATSVLLPLIAAVLDLTLAEGQIVQQVRLAGWAPTSWVVPTIVGVLAVGAVAVCARVARSARLAAVAPVLAAVAAIVAVLPAGTPRLALLLVIPVVALVVELAALLAADDATWSTPLRWAAGGVEVLAAIGVAEVLRLVIAPSAVIGVAADPELAAAFAVGTVAWIVAALRRRITADGDRTLVPLIAGAVVLHAAAALASALPGSRSPAAAVLLVAAAAALLAWSRASTQEASLIQVVTVGTATALVAVGCAAAWGTNLALPLAAVAAPLIGLHVRSLLASGHARAVETAAICIPFALASSLLLALAPGSVDAGVFGSIHVFVVQVAVAVAAAFVLALIVERLPAAADVARVAGVGVLVVAFTPAAIPSRLMDEASTLAQELALVAIRPVPVLLLVLVPALVWLLFDAMRLRRPLVALVAAPVAVRLVVSAGAALGLSPVVIGIVLLVLAVVCVGGVLVTSRFAADALALFAGLAAVPGWALIGATPLARSIALIALGLVGVLIGVARRNGLVGHAGGALATIGVWMLLDLYGLNAVDLWMLPVALQLVVATTSVRRSGSVSSWGVDVPPLLLVAIPAVAERITGGPGYHALVAGGVAMIAILFGGARGRGGPLTAGIAVLLLVVGIETVAFAALVPTWVWFGVAGSVLLGAAVLIERNDLTPKVAVGRLKGLVGDGEAGQDQSGPDQAGQDQAGQDHAGDGEVART